MEIMKYDIFISYRREGGYDTAKHLNDLLVRDGYKVSFDIDTLRSGNFDNQLLERIDQCKDFILVVDQHAFDRTLDSNFNPKNDWLRCELAYALKKQKNIIPVFLSGVTGFPSNLPADIIEVVKKNGPEYNRFYFNDFYKILKQRFLYSTKRSKTNMLPFLVILVLAFGIIGIGTYKTQLLENTVDENNIETVNSGSQSEYKSDEEIYGVPPAPLYQEAKIWVPKPDYFNEEFSACEMADKPFYGYVISSEELSDDIIVVVMQEADTRVKSKFYINKDRMCNADLSWIPYVIVEGNKLKIEYYYEGNAGYQQVITMENLPRK